MYNSFIFNLPIPKFGKILNGCYNAGPMLADDSNGATTEDSKMQIVANVSKADFFDYMQLLKNNGYILSKKIVSVIIVLLIFQIIISLITAFKKNYALFLTKLKSPFKNLITNLMVLIILPFININWFMIKTTFARKPP